MTWHGRATEGEREKTSQQIALCFAIWKRRRWKEKKKEPGSEDECGGRRKELLGRLGKIKEREGAMMEEESIKLRKQKWR